MAGKMGDCNGGEDGGEDGVVGAFSGSGGGSVVGSEGGGVIGSNGMGAVQWWGWGFREAHLEVRHNCERAIWFFRR